MRLTGSESTSEAAIDFMVHGQFGGIGRIDRIPAGTNEYVIPTTWNGRLATRVKAIVYRSGYGFALLDETIGSDPQPVVTLTFKPLGSISVSGRVIAPTIAPDLLVSARYGASWGHPYFGIIDGMILTLPPVTAPVNDSGLFTLVLPDFVSDPVVTSFREESWGYFMVELRDGRGAIRFALDGQPEGQIATLRVSASYPELVLRL